MGDERQQNRNAFPHVAAIVDDFRKVFGPGVKLVWGREPDGREIGKRPADEDAQ